MAWLDSFFKGEYCALVLGFNLFGKGDPARVFFLLGLDTVLTFLLGVVIFNFNLSSLTFISKFLISSSLASACARPPPVSMPPITGLLGDAAARFRVGGVPVEFALCAGVHVWLVPLLPSNGRPGLSLVSSLLPPPALRLEVPVRLGVRGGYGAGYTASVEMLVDKVGMV